MKKIIFRKLLSDCLVFSLVALFGISSIIWVFQAVNFLDIIIEDGRNHNIYLLYTLLNFPKIIAKVLPFCIFFGFSYIFIKYELKNELIIYWNHGIEKISVINFFLIFSVLVFLIQIILLTIVTPKSQEIAKSLIRTSEVDYFEGLIKPKKFNDNIKGLTIFAEEKNKKDEFINIYIKKRTNKDNFQITFAKKGIFEQRKNNKVLVLYEGQNFNNNKNKITNFSFSKSDFLLGDMESHVVFHKKLQEQSTIELVNCIKSIYLEKKIEILNCNQANPRNVYKELFKRFVAPFYLPLLILIAAFNLIITKENINYFKYRFLIFSLGIITIIISESSLGFIGDNFVKNIFLISIPISSILIIYLMIIYKFKIKKINN